MIALEKQIIKKRGKDLSLICANWNPVFDLFPHQSSVEEIQQYQIAELEEEYFPDESPYGLFRTCR